MYQIDFSAVTDADWLECVEMIDADTNLPDDSALAMEFDLRVMDECQNVMLVASTSAGTIERPADNMIQWRFTSSQMAGLCRRKTYDVSCRMIDGDELTSLFVGSLAVL